MLKVSKIVLSLFVLSSVALANQVKETSALNISKADKEFLFNKNDVNTLALNDSEMKHTDGKWVGLAARAIAVDAMRAAQIKGSQNKNQKPKK